MVRTLCSVREKRTNTKHREIVARPLKMAKTEVTWNT